MSNLSWQDTVIWLHWKAGRMDLIYELGHLYLAHTSIDLAFIYFREVMDNVECTWPNFCSTND
jgi:hypothetical protein